MSYHVRYTRRARQDIKRLYKFLLEKDIRAAELALHRIRESLKVLEEFPFTCRKTSADNPFLRELIVPFGAAGYVLLFEIEDEQHVTILAVRHQREDDYF